MQRRILIGTSGFSYPEWKGSFYPEKLPSKKYLSYYAEHFPTTEINNTFYRIPTSANTAEWYKAVGADFSFTLKLSQRITHQKKLQNCEEEMSRFLDAAKELREKMGPILVQLPPFFKQNLQVLQEFLEAHSANSRLAFEFRHDSWFEESTYQMLQEHGCSLAVVESEERKAEHRVTGNFVYMRLRKEDYSKEELFSWSKWMGEESVDVYCYLKHDVKAPAFARQLMDLLA